MPRISTDQKLQNELNHIISAAATDIAAAVRQNIATEVARMVGGDGRGRITSLRAGRVVRKRAQIMCPICNKPAGGPKWRWACAEHKSLPKEKLRKARAAAKMK